MTIRRIVSEEVKTDRGSDMRACAYFEESKDQGSEKEKRYIMNITGCRVIAKIYNDPEMEHWVGKKITLYQTTCMVGKEVKDCIRIRDTAPAAGAPAADIDAAEAAGA